MNIQPSGGGGNAAHGRSNTLSHGVTSTSSSFLQASMLDVPSGGSDDLHLGSALNESISNDMTRTNAFADRNTIVDMSLRFGRFLICVILAMAFAFGFAFVTSNKKTLTHVDENKLAANENLSTKASSLVEDYNALMGYILFAGGKVFEVFCETLIFPTLATYLHNCSLYPGDQPARMHSVAKSRCIFWGLKTVGILMNVGFTSVYVGQTTLTPAPTTTSRRLLASDEWTTGIVRQVEPRYALDAGVDVLRSILSTSVTGVTAPFEYKETCQWREQGTKNRDQQQSRAWADDVDTTFVSFSFPSHAWSLPFLTSHAPMSTRRLEIPLRDYWAHREKYAINSDWNTAELFSIFQQSIAKLGFVSAAANVTSPRSLEELVRAVASELKTILPSRARVNDLVMRLEYRKVAQDVKFTTLTLSVPLRVDNPEKVRCGTSGCVYATSTNVLEELQMQPSVFIAPNSDDVNSAFVYSTSSQYVWDLEVAEETPHEELTFSLSKMTWHLSPVPDAVCANEAEENHCLGLRIPFGAGGAIFVSKDALSKEHIVHPVPLVTLHVPVIPEIRRSEESTVLTSWHRLVAPNGDLVRPSSSDCVSLVDAYLTHLESNRFYLDGHQAHELVSVALLYLLQRGVPTWDADVTLQRRLTVMTSNETAGATADIEVNVPTTTAMVTVAGCIFIVGLMICVICLPTSRVKLSPDTTPAAQYVQILTDDLYPDLVHKKRLRFANGDCLLFNEYVVDAIVLHAKREQSKKIYL
ncbi:hypothetical protein PsorP6_015385 [Peronosclerospora sorghi]|uniref:Uncharacterized protein n=1 Tax=Peronosclerospora sorghi TaxID=230839 RepID=A0ACC0WMC6_9STRA|nr:hypothetical protein PsorP6_015385 [Peronosclerospora sorghi]